MRVDYFPEIKAKCNLMGVKVLLWMVETPADMLVTCCYNNYQPMETMLDQMMVVLKEIQLAQTSFDMLATSMVASTETTTVELSELLSDMPWKHCWDAT